MSKSRLLVCAFCAGMLGFIALTLWAAGGRYLPGEQELLTVITTHRLPALNPLALVISTLGSINILLPLWAILVLGLVICRQGDALLRFVPVPLGYPLYALVKSLIARPASTPIAVPVANKPDETLNTNGFLTGALVIGFISLVLVVWLFKNRRR